VFIYYLPQFIYIDRRCHNSEFVQPDRHRGIPREHELTGKRGDTYIPPCGRGRTWLYGLLREFFIWAVRLSREYRRK